MTRLQGWNRYSQAFSHRIPAPAPGVCLSDQDQTAALSRSCNCLCRMIPTDISWVSCLLQFACNTGTFSPFLNLLETFTGRFWKKKMASKISQVLHENAIFDIQKSLYENTHGHCTRLLKELVKLRQVICILVKAKSLSLPGSRDKPVMKRKFQQLHIYVFGTVIVKVKLVRGKECFRGNTCLNSISGVTTA